LPDTLKQVVDRVKAAKTAIGNAITAKGGTVGANDGLEDFADDITSIPSGGVEFSESPRAFTLLSNIRNLDVIIPNGVTSIGTSAFQNCTGLTSIEIPSGVTSIGNNAFQNCTGLTSIELPSGVTSIGNSAFQNCTGLTSIEIPSGVTTIGDSAFQNCTGLTSIEIPNSVTASGNNAFQNCTGLTRVKLSNSQSAIGQRLFYLCSNLHDIEIPESVGSIGTKAFDNSGMRTIKFIGSTPPTVSNSNAFGNCPLNTIYVPSGSLTAYTSAANYPSSSSVNYVEY
jgi:hypothetical protein